MSPYAAAVPALIESIQREFTNVFGLSQPYRSDDILPGERYGIIDFETYGRDPDRPRLGKNRGGNEAKELRCSLLIETAFQGSGNDEQDFVTSNNLFIQLAFEIEDGLAAIKGNLEDYGFVYELDLNGTIDKLVSLPLKQRKTANSAPVWKLQVSCDAAVKLMVNRQINGRHVLPLTANERIY